MAKVKEKPKCAWVFPGQSPEAVSSNIEEVIRQCEAAPQILEEASDIFGEDIDRLCTSDPKEIQRELQQDTYLAQAAIMTKNEIYLAAVEGLGYEKPCYGAGQSVAELFALRAAGVMTRTQMFQLTAVRARGMLDAPQGMMVALMDRKPLPMEEIEEICRTYGVVIGLNNSRDQVVICGLEKAVRKVAEEATRGGYAKVAPVNPRYAFHSPLMADAAVAVAEKIGSMQFQDPSYPVIANSTLELVKDAGSAKRVAVQGISNSVQWGPTIELLDEEVDEVYEIGPASVLTKLAHRNLQYPPASSKGKRKRWGRIVKLMAIGGGIGAGGVGAAFILIRVFGDPKKEGSG